MQTVIYMNSSFSDRNPQKINRNSQFDERLTAWKNISDSIVQRGLIISAWWAATPDRNVTWITNTEDLCWEADQHLPSVPSQWSTLRNRVRVEKKQKKKKSSLKNLSSHKKGIKSRDVSQSVISRSCFCLGRELMKCNRRVVLFCSQWKGKGGTERQKTGNVRVEIFLCFQHRKKRNVSNVARPAASPRLHCCLLARRRASFENEEQGPSDRAGGGLNCHKAALLTRWWITFISVRLLI